MVHINRKLKIFKCALKSGTTPFASLFVTRRCNLRCGFCAIQDHPRAELSTDQWKEAMRRLMGFGVRNITFTGGEPFLREDIGELTRFASLKLECITWLFSNLARVTEEKLAAVRDLDFLCASVDHPEGETEKSFTRAIGLLKKSAAL